MQDLVREAERRAGGRTQAQAAPAKAKVAPADKDEADDDEDDDAPVAAAAAASGGGGGSYGAAPRSKLPPLIRLECPSSIKRAAAEEYHDATGPSDGPSGEQPAPGGASRSGGDEALARRLSAEWNGPWLGFGRAPLAPAASFVADRTLPDGSAVSAGAKTVKVHAPCAP